MNQEFQNEIVAAEETAVAEQEAQTEEIVAETDGDTAAAVPEQEEAPKKKKSKAGKVALGIVIALLALVLVVAIALGVFGAVLFNKATAPVELPSKYDAADMTEFGLEAAVGLLKENKIVVDNSDMQMLMDKVKPTVEASLEGTPFKLEDLYCVLDGDMGNIYGEVFISEVEVSGIKLKVNKSVAFSANFDVSFEENTIIAKIQEIKCGELSVPVSLVSGFMANVKLPEGLTFAEDTICYDVTGLDSMVDGILTDMLNEKLGDGALASLVTDFLVKEVNAEINGADIVGQELIIDGKVL